MAHANTRTARTLVVVLVLIALAAVGLAIRKSMAAPTDVRMATVDGRGIAYRLLGKGGPAIVMISGLGDSMGSFKTVAAGLAKSSTVIVYDRAGYGASAPMARPADAKAASDDLSAVLGQSGVKGPYVIVGHSIGGLYAEYFAATHPNQVAGLVLEESRPADFTRRCRAARISGCTPSGVLARLLPSAAQGEAAALAATTAQVEAATPLRGLPVLVISRAGTTHPSPFERLWETSQADLLRRYPGATHMIAPKGGHYVHHDQAAWFVGQIRRFAKPRSDA